MSWRCCFVVKAKLLCLAFQKRTQLEISGYVLFTTLFQNSSTQIFRCVQHHVSVLKGCFYKVGQFQLCKDSLALLTHSLITVTTVYFGHAEQVSQEMYQYVDCGENTTALHEYSLNTPLGG